MNRFMGIVDPKTTADGTNYISAHLMGRKAGVRIYGFVNEDGVEEFTISRTSGQSNGFATAIATIKAESDEGLPYG